MDRQRPKKNVDEVVALVRERGKRGELPLAERRVVMDKNTEVFPAPSNVRMEPINLGGLKAEWMIPQGRSLSSSPVLLYFHGGGYVIGSPLSHRHVTGKLALSSDACVLSVDYALAPEQPFPAAVTDGVKAYRWLLDRGHAADAIAFGGDSAGGGLVMATLIAARDEGLPMPAGAVLISPWTDLTCNTETYKSRAAVDPMITPDGIAVMANAYLAGADPRNPLASPNFADLAGLPPLLIHVGDNEVLLDDARILAKRAQEAGVDARIEVWDRMFHVWHAFYQMLDEGEQAIDALGKFLRGRFEPLRAAAKA
ncbi:MAG: alpha/beta hydrolase [Parvibaculum sp.]|uniref:alpha/beta hydrolase n=1 Tax=Parvibaculum sp. TaxID=2024848 RepID=UPI0025F8FC2B|nr:alpha/beta hydrolase [Parvibaculum sp.]MCE9649589.1 alpha/beta hydrolase [Parvibaculum sp.]